MKRLNPSVARQHERRLDALREAMDRAEGEGNDASFLELRGEYIRLRETFAELRQGPEREDDA